MSSVVRCSCRLDAGRRRPGNAQAVDEHIAVFGPRPARWRQDRAPSPDAHLDPASSKGMAENNRVAFSTALPDRSSACTQLDIELPTSSPLAPRGLRRLRGRGLDSQSDLRLQGFASAWNRRGEGQQKKCSWYPLRRRQEDRETSHGTAYPTALCQAHRSITGVVGKKGDGERPPVSTAAGQEAGWLNQGEAKTTAARKPEQEVPSTRNGVR